MKRSKVCIIVVAVLLVTLCVTMLSGCVYIDGGYYMHGYYPEYESGYFRYAVETYTIGESTEKVKRAHIIGLTETGLQQVGLVFPDELNGIPVDGITYSLSPIYMWDPCIKVGDFRSEKLEKIFFLDSPRRYVGMELQTNIFSVFWKLDVEFANVRSIDGAAIIGYDYYMEKIHRPYKYDCKNCIANVTYMYNYKDSPNKGVYWVDSYNESIITYIPPTPEREGYEFVGWYKDEECTEAWDFEKDITDKEVIIERYTVYDKEYEGIYLYAKWIKI